MDSEYILRGSVSLIILGIITIIIFIALFSGFYWFASRTSGVNKKIQEEIVRDTGLKNVEFDMKQNYAVGELDGQTFIVSKEDGKWQIMSKNIKDRKCKDEYKNCTESGGRLRFNLDTTK